MKIYWKHLHHPIINEGYLISNIGMIRNEHCCEDESYGASYHASNGYDFVKMVVKESKRYNDNPIRLFPIDELIGYAFIPVPDSLKNKPKIINHINGDTHDISLDNLEWIEDVEEWKICTYPGVQTDAYEVSSWGGIRDNISKENLTIRFNTFGYAHVYLHKSNMTSHMIHRLVNWEFCIHDTHFIEKQVNHIDGIKSHNHWKNLESVTTAENTRHAVITGLVLTGDKNPSAKLSNETVETICELIVKYEGHIPSIQNDLIKRNINVDNRILSAIKNKRIWVTVSDKFFKTGIYRSYKTNIGKKEVHEMCKMLIKYNMDVNKVIGEMASKGTYVSKSCVKHIKYKCNWTNVSNEYF